MRSFTDSIRQVNFKKFLQWKLNRQARPSPETKELDERSDAFLLTARRESFGS